MAQTDVPLLPSAVRWLVVGAVAALLVWTSVTRPPEGVSLIGPFGLLRLDKYLHGLAYAGLAATVAYALVGTDVPRIALVAFGAAIAFGLGVELLQGTIPYRTRSVADAAANAVGAGLVAVCWQVVVDRVRFRPVGAPRLDPDR